ncbi:hypothetical protein GQ44DRAFT_727706 [Phaeosphaeriaceae sp. PMI808]|nr:hypothetical protein GQ44DRAFT_727706 [Phaeosphaeriaceae sp. PMI808]
MYRSSVGDDLILNTYDNVAPESRPGSYDKFLAIAGNISDTTGMRNMSSLAEERKSSNTYCVYFGTLTFSNDLRAMTQAHKIYKDALSNLKRKSEAKGGNVLDLERFSDQVLCLYQIYISWKGAQQNTLFKAAGADLVKQISYYAKSIGANNSYLYLGYADGAQGRVTSYGMDNVQKMKTAGEKYDPSGVFQNLVSGGFKISMSHQSLAHTTYTYSCIQISTHNKFA